MNKLIGIGVLLLAYGSAWAGAQEDDLINLAKSGVNAEVLTAYVDAAKGPFHLTVDQIIELNKLGVSSHTISAALKHGGQAESYPYPGNANYPAAPANGSYSTSAEPPAVAPDTVAVATSPDVEVYPYPDPYYDYWPYVGLGWWWGPSYAWWGGYYGHGYYGHGPAVRGGSPGFHSSGQFARGGWGGSRGAWGGGGSRGWGGRSGGGGRGGGRAGGGGRR
jgi:hypothetical protein